jgi:hypothetical protein
MSSSTMRLTEGQDGRWYYVAERDDGSITFSKSFPSEEAAWQWILSPRKTNSNPRLYSVPPPKGANNEKER